jgi:hypothetical protein
MSLINHTITGLYGGVSQQPSNLRLDEQCDKQTNAISSIVDGVYKRPPSEYINNLLINSNNIYDNSFFYNIKYKNNYNYFILTNDNDLISFDEKGKYINVEYQDDIVEDYVKKTEGFKSNDIKITKVEDYYILTNTTKEVAIRSYNELTTDDIYINRNPYYINVTLPEREDKLSTYKLSVDSIEYEISFGRTLSNWTDSEIVGIFLDRFNSSNIFEATQTSGDTFNITRLDKQEIVKVYSETSSYDKNISIRHNSFDITFLGGEELETSPIISNYFFNVKQGIPENKYTIKLTFQDDSSKEYTYETTTDASTWSTLNITEELTKTINDDEDNDITAIQNFNSCKVKSNDNNVKKIEAFDGSGDISIYAFKDTVDSIDKLPARFFNGIVIQVKGVNDKYGFYNTYIDNNWKEYKKIGISHTIDENTMPKKISFRSKEEYINNDNKLGIYIYIENIIWNSRQVGDNDTAPFPSFVNKKINNSFMFKGRLGFLSDYNVILSKANDFSNFFPSTVKEILDDTPIDINSSNENSQVLKNYSVYNNNLLLFSDYSQMVLTTNNKILTLNNIIINQTTNYSVNNFIKPITVGPNVYFVDQNNNSSNIREYFLLDNSISNEANNITLHVPNYLPKSISNLKGDNSSNILLLTNKDNKKELYVYNYFWSQNEKIQTAWSKFLFNDDILNIEIIDNYIYLITRDDYNNINLEIITLDVSNNYTTYLDKFISSGFINLNGVYDEEDDITLFRFQDDFYPSQNNIVTTNQGLDITNEVYSIDNYFLKINGEYDNVNFKNNLIDNSIDFNIMLDKRVEIDGILILKEDDNTYEQNYIKYTIPYIINDITKISIIDKINGFNITKIIITHYIEDNKTIIITKETDDKKVNIGYNYNMEYVFNKFDVKQNNTNVSNTSGHLQIRNINISFVDTGYFNVEVENIGRTKRVKQYTGTRLGLGIIGKVKKTSGNFKTTILGNNEKIKISLTNNSYLPSKFQTANWEAYYISRSSNI